MKKPKLTKLEDDLLIDILSNTPLAVFNELLESYSFQMVYERHRFRVATGHFGGDLLRCSIALRNIFNKFLTLEDEQRVREIRAIQEPLMRRIKLNRKAGRPIDDLIKQYNDLAAEHNEIGAKFEPIRKMYRKILKTTSCK